MKIKDYFHAPLKCAPEEEGEAPVRRSSRGWLALLIAAIAFAVNFKIASRLDGLGVFRQYDVLFDTDPEPNLRALEQAGVDDQHVARSQHDFVHANQILYLKPFIRFGVALMGFGESTPLQESNLRHQLVILSSPVLAAITAMCTLWVFLGLGLTLVQALLLTLLGCASFTQWIFFSMPESFPFSGMLLAATCLLAVRSCRPGTRRWQWILATVLITGVTITNALAVALLFTLMRLFGGQKFHLAALDAAAVVGIGVIATAAIAVGSGNLEPVDEIKNNGPRFVTKWSVQEPIYTRAAGFPTALVNAVVAPKPTKVDNIRARKKKSKYRFMMTLRESPSAFSIARIFDLSLLVLFVAGLIGCSKGSRAVRYLGAGSVAVLGFNWTLHSVWGQEFFLYSQHWQMFFLVPFAGLFSFPAKSHAYWIVALTATLAYVIVKNRIALDVIWATLGA